MTPVIQLPLEDIYGRARYYRTLLPYEPHADDKGRVYTHVVHHLTAFQKAITQMAATMDDWWLGQVDEHFTRSVFYDNTQVSLLWETAPVTLMSGSYSRPPEDSRGPSKADAWEQLTHRWSEIHHHLHRVDTYRGLLFLVKGYLNTLITELGYTQGDIYWEKGCLVVFLQNTRETPTIFYARINLEKLNQVNVL